MRRDRLFESHNSIPRNPLIAKVLYWAGYIENLGSGLTDIRKECEKNDIPLPIIDDSDGMMRFSIRRKFVSTPPDTPPDTQPDTPPVYRRLLKSINGEMNTLELMAKLNISDKRYFRGAYINPAIAEGVIERTIPDKPSSRYQKYRLTQKGREVLASLR